MIKNVFFNIYLFILERESVSKLGRSREKQTEKKGERESQAGSMLTAQGPTQGSVSQNVRS